MKTILYQPLFINPQAYFVFPQLYHIEKGDSYIEPANITGQLIINDLTQSLTSTPILNVVQDTNQVDFGLFKGKHIRISQYTNIGADRQAFVPTGTTNSLGNSSGQVQYSYVNTDAEGTETQASQYANRYRGIENPFGHVWKNCCDIVVTGTDNKIYVTNNKENFGIDKSLYEDSGLTTITTGNQWVKRITNNAAADLFCQEGGAGSTTYFCDYHWTNAVEADRTLLLGADAGDGSFAGLFSLYSNNDLSNANANVSTMKHDYQRTISDFQIIFEERDLASWQKITNLNECVGNFGEDSLRCFR